MVARTPHALSVVCFVPGEGGMAQDRSRMEHKNKRRVPGVFISYHGAYRRLALLWKTQTHHRRHDDDNDPRHTKNAPCAIARPVPRVECVGGGHGGVVVLVSRACSFVWCVTPRGAGAFKSQAAAAAWWDVSWHEGRTKRHEVGVYSFHGSLKRSPSAPMAKPRGLDEKCQ